NGISVRVVTGNRRVHSTATLTLYDAGGANIIARSLRSTLEFDDNSWQRFPLDSIAGSDHATYCFSVETDAEYEAVALRPNPAGADHAAAEDDAGDIEFCVHYFDALAHVLDPLLFQRDPKAPPPIPAEFERYLDRHVYECIRLRRYFFLRLVHLADAFGRIGSHEEIRRVLSVGAGAAFQEAFLAGRFPGMHVLASDSEPCLVDYPMPNLAVGRLDLLAGPGAPEYDFVFSIECLEHIEDFRTAFRNKAARVKPGGFLYISVPFASPDEQRDEGLRQTAWEQFGHYTPGFTFEDLEELFAANGLEVLHASNMFYCDLVHPLRALVDHQDEATIESAAGEIVRLYLQDVSDTRVRDSKAAEGIRFLGRKPVTP
ncbi:MAG: methyltransferase domain-containing protein, partial [Casimicrobiaceae bacterium]